MFFDSTYTPIEETPKTGKDDRYFSVSDIPKDGEVIVRLFGPSISGWQWFSDTPEGRIAYNLVPLHKDPGKHPPGIRKKYKSEELETPRRIIACLIWNATDKKFQIFKIDRESVIKQIEKIVIPPKGYEEDYQYQFLPVEGTKFSVANFGLLIRKTGEALNTKYDISALMRPCAKDVLKSLKDLDPQPYLPAMYLSEDPWKGEGVDLTPAAALPTQHRDENGADYEIEF